MITVADIKDILQRYQGRYVWLDVLVSDVRELRTESDLRWRRAGEDRWEVSVDGETLQMDVDDDEGVARFRMAPAINPGAGAATGAALGAILGAAIAAGVRKGAAAPENTILGLLVGGLAGGVVGNLAAQQPVPDENRILTLRFDRSQGEWRVYHGPLVNWAKEALYVGGQPA
jgi:hypothetical protein